jgi:hypothetical protein
MLSFYLHKRIKTIVLFAKLFVFRENICYLPRDDRSLAAENVVTTKFLNFVNIDWIFATSRNGSWRDIYVCNKEDTKEQPTSRNLSATATRVLQCTCPVAATQKYFSAIHTSPHLTLAFVNNIILHLLLVLCSAVNVRNKN